MRRLLLFLLVVIFVAIVLPHFVMGVELASANSRYWGRTVIVAKNVRIEPGLYEFILKRIAAEIQERRLGRVVREKENIKTIIEINEFSLKFQQATGKVDHRFLIERRVPDIRPDGKAKERTVRIPARISAIASQGRVTILFGATILDSRGEELTGGTAFGKAEGYIASASSRPPAIGVSNYAFTTREELTRQATADAIRNWFNYITTMMTH